MNAILKVASSVLYAAAIMFFTAETRPAIAQPCLDWRQPLPAVRYQHPMVFDSKRGVAVLFGGNDQSGYGGTSGETWEWNGFTWAFRGSDGPAERKRHAMAYDSVRGVTVLFGGQDGYQSFGDTWEWDGQTWTLRAVSGPSARYGHAMAFDESRGVTVMFGAGGSPAATWEWNGSSWVLRSVSGPSYRTGHAMVYDPVRKSVLMFGGLSGFNYFADTWEWKGTGNGSWTLITSDGPAGRHSPGMTYDASRNVALLFGGATAESAGIDDTWEFDSVSAQWMQVQPPNAPSTRYSAAMCYDSVRNQALLYGGIRFFAAHADLWRYDSLKLNWSVIRAQPGVWDGAKLAYDSQRRAMVLYGRAGPGGETWEFAKGTWKLVATSGPPTLAQHAMTFDSARGVTVLFGGYTYPAGTPNGQTWEWNGDNWMLRAESGPPPRWDHCLEYDPIRQVSVLYGGTIDNLNGMSDLWEWDGNQWIERAQSGPPPRKSFGMTFDAGPGKVLIYGGGDYVPGIGNQTFRDMWEWDGTVWQERTFNLFAPFPGNLSHFAMAYDTHRHFAMVSVINNAEVTWQWNGTSWSQLLTPTAFPTGAISAMAYDSTRHVMMLWRGDGSSAIWEFSVGADCAADTDGDGLVNIDDLLEVIGNWGPCVGEPCSGDVNGDGIVSIDDLLAVIAAWT